MADRPIIFSAPMVRAIIEGRKTQTRRVLKVQAAGHAYRLAAYDPNHTAFFASDDTGALQKVRLPYAPGDRLYVREAHALLPRTAYRGSIGTGTIAQIEHPTDGYTAAVFREGFDRSGPPRWRPSIHMPRWASRLTLTVTEVRVQRLQDISEADAVAEGVEVIRQHDVQLAKLTPENLFAYLWNSLHGPDAWDKNPWVVALTFTVQQRNIDAGGA